MPIAEHAQLLLRGVAIPLAAVITLQAAWAVARLAIPGPSPAALRLIAGRLSATIAAGGDVGAALLGLQAQVRWPYPWRIRRAADALGGGQPPALVDALISARLLPIGLAASARAAASGGAGPLSRFFAELAGPVQGLRSHGAMLAPYLGVTLAAIGSLTYMAVYILPKFEQIFKDLGLALPARTQSLLSIGRFCAEWWPPLLLLAGIGIGSVVVAMRRRTWRRLARRSRALAILDGVAAGAGEGAIAARLDPEVAPARPAAAAATHGFPALCAACGWSAATPAALAAAVAADDARQRWLTTLTTVLVQILTPLLLAIPVWFIVSGIFMALVAVLNALESQ
jgi:hypothetical protein